MPVQDRSCMTTGIFSFSLYMLIKGAQNRSFSFFSMDVCLEIKDYVENHALNFNK
jgi:hypothetical protein